MKLSYCLCLLPTLFLSASVFAATCPPVKVVNQQINRVRDKANNINWRIDEITRFKGAFYQEKTNHTKASFTCVYNRKDGTYLNVKLENNIISRLNEFGNNWDYFYNPTLRSCDGNKISGVEDCSFTLKN